MYPTLVKNVWMLSREYGELAGAGGVKDVVRQLAEAIVRTSDVRVNVVIPLYGFILPEENNLVPVGDPIDETVPLQFMIDMNYGLEERRESCRIWKTGSGPLSLYLIESQRFREKTNIYTYTEKDTLGKSWVKSGTGHYDYFAMNILLQKSALELMVILGEKPDVIHCHDGHTALVPALIHECQGWQSYFRDTGCVVTIHNAGVGYHQEVADLPFAHGVTGLTWKCIGENRLSGKFDPFLAAGQYAILNTVSENYARELQDTGEDVRTDWLGHTLRERGVHIEGITNGISPEDFDTTQARNLGLSEPYDPAAPEEKMVGKKKCKNGLLEKLRAGETFPGVTLHGELLKDGTHPLFGFVGRISEQKGVDLLLAAIELLFGVHDHGQLLILGSGTDMLEAKVLSLAEKEHMQGRLCFLRGYNPALANQVFAASDFFIIPSRYEPCGLTDYIAQLFGSVPIVHHVGGLVKVEDGQTGLAYFGGTAGALANALQRALRLYEDKKSLYRIRKRAIQTIQEKYTWDVVKEQYMELYARAKEQRAQERSI